MNRSRRYAAGQAELPGLERAAAAAAQEPISGAAARSRSPRARPARPQLFTLAAGVPFLDAVARWWLEHAAATGEEPSGQGELTADPLAAARGLILLPTRRAARSLAEAFLRATNGRPLLLPRMVALGALDETPLAITGALDLAPAVAPAERLALLTRLILQLGGRHGAPATADRAWPLAVELARLLDEAERAEIDLAAALPEAAEAGWAEHWQVTLDFLGIVTRSWPNILAAAGQADPAARQRALIDAQAAAWTAVPPDHPVIAAGMSVASPAATRLLRVIAGLPQGMVILPGLDLALDAAAFDGLEDSHPQAGLRRLLNGMGATRGDVAELPGTSAEGEESARAALLRRALLPAEALDRWGDGSRSDPGQLSRIDAADQQEEATAIALVLREALEQPARRAALVTPDRDLARRVSAELLRFGVIADDSAGEPLAETPPAVFLRLLAAAFAADLAPVPLLSLLKHPLCAAGLAPSTCRAAARALEVRCLRGPRPGPGIAGLRQRRGEAGFLDRLQQRLAPLLDLATAHTVAPAAALAALLAAAEALAASDRESGAERLWSGEEGEALAAHLASLGDAVAGLPLQPPGVLPGLLDAALEGIVVRSRRALRGRDGAEHPRVFIWGLLEARLQAVDLIVLGGLVEGVWPAATDPGPWMSRQMRRRIGLPSPEEQIGQAAHDFVMAACAAPRTVLSAPRRRDGAPAVPSRWLSRIDAMPKTRPLALHPATLWARALDRPAGAPEPVAPPAPRPPVHLRPRRLSVTEIETWLRDPYAIYARHVLGLRALDPLDQSADAADYGRIVHDAMRRFLARVGIHFPADAAATLRADMAAALAAADLRPALAAWWRPRLERIAAWIVAAEADRRSAGPLAAIAAEVAGEWRFPCPAGEFLLTARADRIERRHDGSIAILDYKTGKVPSKTDVLTGLSPQLTLEAAMVEEGAFGAELTGVPVELVYWHLQGGYQPGEVFSIFATGKNADKSRADLDCGIATAKRAVCQLVSEFCDPARAYLSRPHPGAAPRFSDYQQLARAGEWAAIDEARDG